MIIIQSYLFLYFRNKIYIAPSGVQKERIQPEELFVQTIDDEDLELPPPEKKYVIFYSHNFYDN